MTAGHHTSAWRDGFVGGIDAQLGGPQGEDKPAMPNISRVLRCTTTSELPNHWDSLFTCSLIHQPARPERGQSHGAVVFD